MKYSVLVPKLKGDNTSIRTSWCVKNIGRQTMHWNINLNVFDEPGLTRFLFINESDALLFALRWAGVEV